MPTIDDVVQFLPADRDSIFISRKITRSLYEELSDVIPAQKSHKHCTLFLTTRGGDAHSGYRIARCLRHHYEHVRLVVPSRCKSAGTLIAIAADEMAIGDMGELGPLDVQVNKHDEIFERSSGLDFGEALAAATTHTVNVFRKILIEVRAGTGLSTRLAGDFATAIASSAASALYAQIDPQKVGAMNRAMTIAVEYGVRLHEMSRSLKSTDRLFDLVASYPSHSFVIDRKEAATLFNRVGHPTAEEQEVFTLLWDSFQEERNFGPVIRCGNHRGDSYEQQGADASRIASADDRTEDGADGDQSEGCEERRNGADNR
ncbi:MAG: hypothetical protein M0Q95_20315 [Porticoccaceae bacterium]|nr:hypothetical protein [Porticoccaceae bacterium]